MRRLIMLVVSAALLAGLAVVVPSVVTPSRAPQAQAHNGGDGCSVPGNFVWDDAPGGFWFHNACDRHDRDYRDRPDGASAAGRWAADWRFLQNMRAECQSYPWALQRCYDWAWRYFTGVRAGGWAYYYRVEPWIRDNVQWYIV
jgi:hypothetical protein